MFDNLLMKYEKQIRYMLYGAFFAILGYFMATMPTPLSGAVGMVAALIIVDELRKIDWMSNVDWMSIGYFITSLVLMFLSPPAIISTPGVMYAGVMLNAITSAVIVTPKLSQGFKILVIMLTSVFPPLNCFTIIVHIILAPVVVFKGYILIYIIVFVSSYVLINKKDLLK